MSVGAPLSTASSHARSIRSVDEARAVLSVVPSGAVPPLPLPHERMTMTTWPPRITGGVDTHLDMHVAAVGSLRSTARTVS